MAYRVTPALALALAGAGFVGAPASADPVTAAVVTASALSVGAGVGGALLAGTALTAAVWGSIATTAAITGITAGLSAYQSRSVKSPRETNSRTITQTAISDVSTGLILYGERVLGGTLVARSSSPHGTMRYGRYHSIIVFACHEVEAYEKIWLGETLVWTRAQYESDVAAAALPNKKRGLTNSKYQDAIGIIPRFGTANQTNIGAFSYAEAGWPGEARGRGIAYLYFEFDFGDLFESGPPTVTAQIKGKKCYDPRMEDAEYTTNPALHFLDYMTTAKQFGGVGWPEDALDLDRIIALANVCEEQVPTADGATQDRYAFNGVLETSASPAANLDALSSSWGGSWADDRGELRVTGGYYETPSLHITEDMVVAAIATNPRRNFEDQINTLKAAYADETEKFTATSLPVLSSATYLAEDGEESLHDMGELPGETNLARGQRLMKIEMLKARRQRTCTVPCNFSAWHIGVGDTVTITTERLWKGWTDKPFEVQAVERAATPDDCRVTLSLIETAASVYDWTTSEETPHAGVLRSTLPNPTDAPEVSAPEVSEELYEARGGGGLRLRVNLSSATDNPFVRNWQFAWYPADGDLSDAVTSAISSTASAQLVDFEPGAWVFGARAINARGIVGDWAWAGTTQVLGLGAEPVAVPNLSIQPSGTVAVLKWSRHPDLDVRQGGYIEFRHADSLVGGTWSTGRAIGNAVAGSSTETSLPLLPGTYIARAVDSTGLIGSEATVTTRAPALIAGTQVAQVVEAPTFGGTATDCTVDAGALSIDVAATSATYDFAGQIDLGSVETVRLVSEVSMLIAARDDLFWKPDGEPFWTGAGQFWTGTGGDGDLQILVSETDDDPAGSPVWSDYVPLHASDLIGRAFRFRAAFSVATAADVVTATGLTITAYQ